MTEEYIERVSKLQKDVVQSIISSNGHGIIALATGVGKTKIAIDYLIHANFKRVLWVVPTRMLRDYVVRKEFEKFDAMDVFENVETICYQSISKLKNQTYDCVILDEGHHITPANAVFFDNNKCLRVLMLTATVPVEREKKQILYRLNLKPIHTIDVNKAVKEQVVAPYKIYVIPVEMDNVNKNVRAGNKQKGWMTTEQQHYNWICKSIDDTFNRLGYVPKAQYLGRMRFIQASPSKEKTAQKLLNRIPDHIRTIIFCSSIGQAERLCPHRFHSQTTDEDYHRFNNKEINRISVVKALNEGSNMKDVDLAIIVQSSSKDREYLQRQGRIIRWKDNHEPIIYLLKLCETVDEFWVEQSLTSLDKKRIINVKKNSV